MSYRIPKHILMATSFPIARLDPASSWTFVLQIPLNAGETMCTQLLTAAAPWAWQRIRNDS